MFSVLAILALLSLLLTLWQWVVALRFPLHERVAQAPGFAPGITLLKPIKGCDSRTEDCLRSWLRQDYAGEVQVLFGIASPADPAVKVVKQLIREHPGKDLQLVMCHESLGINAKVSSLIQLARQAKHEIIAVSDADVHVPVDYIVNAVAPLSDERVGLVNSFYRLANPTTLAMHCEAVAINADFWSQVLQGRSIQPLDFALGAVMITRQAQLREIGGFEALADYLADDFQLGNRIARAGRRIEICPVVVDCLSVPMGWREVWSHQLRWSRTIRVSKPLPYALSILSNPTFWPLLFLVSCQTGSAAACFATCLMVRLVIAHSLQLKMRPGETGFRYFWMPPIKDLLHFAHWVCAFGGNTIAWRGQKYRLRKDGRLVRK